MSDLSRRSFISTVPALVSYFWGAKQETWCRAAKARRIERVGSWADGENDLKDLANRLTESLAGTGWVVHFERRHHGMYWSVAVTKPYRFPNAPYFPYASPPGWGWSFDLERMRCRETRLADMDKAYDDLMSIFLEPSFLRT
jgi:hypothetical protein